MIVAQGTPEEIGAQVAELDTLSRTLDQMAQAISDDLARRDLTINAIAMDEHGTLIDPFGGERDQFVLIVEQSGDRVDRQINADKPRGGKNCDFRFRVVALGARRNVAKLLEQAQRFQPGRDVAITPGQVVMRNRLVELIRYAPATATVHPEPLLVLPSWIMKYYILDLSPENSLVRWLVDQGHTVFILSWRNPDESDALLGMADYLEQGVLDNLAAIARLVPEQPVHACGYCLGGTLLSLAAAALARPGQVAGADQLPALASVSLLAAETDFSEPGEMGVLIDESQVTMIEDMMAERGYLSGRQMAGSFAYLHSRELVWSQKMRELWLGEPNQPNDLMAWNADLTRMPAAMHSEYLRRCYLHNEIATGRFPVQGRPVSLTDLRLPVFSRPFRRPNGQVVLLSVVPVVERGQFAGALVASVSAWAGRHD